MTAFTTAELRRLSEAATSGDWIELCCYINGRPRNDVDSLAVRGSVVGPQGYICEAAYQGPRCDDDMRLIAYLGTHREAILRMLEAADALAVQVEECDEAVDVGSVWHALAAYKKARGE